MSTPGFEELQKVLAKILDVSPDEVKKTSVAKDFKNWDSISHSSIVLDIEDAFDVEFDDEEIFSFTDVGHIYDTVMKKLGAAG
ncbi:acyl carrier protein [Zavarzinia compransoris]|uniref:acyl carrier protein n=1 Tax=Zavarzinia marina TaxID=2911065 RepID=UPI001F381ECA|nr:acyl carrier protein [Zavarzinia marina]MCF4167275.1 acyl carrier protein [Zavarzinia marina]